MRDYFQGGKVKHWCEDPYQRAAFPYPRSSLEFQLSEFQSSISNIHFIDEHTSRNRGWVERAISSAISAALSITEKGETTFDVIIVGGDPIGLMTFICLSWKEPTLHITIIEKESIINSDTSSGTFNQQELYQMHNEEYLSELSNMSFPLWRQLERIANLSFGSILNTDDGYLFFVHANMSHLTLEENFVSIKRTCENRQMGYKYLNSIQLESCYPIFLFPPQSEGIFHNQSGYINVTTLIMGLLHIINQNENILIREKEEFLSLNFDNKTKFVTDHGVLYASRKVLFVPGAYTENLSHLLNFDLNIKLREFPIYYFGRFLNDTLFST